MPLPTPDFPINDYIFSRKDLENFLNSYPTGLNAETLIQALAAKFELTIEPRQIICDGFDSPVGTVVERASNKLWPGTWYDATGYGTYYTSVGAAYHTGVDLNNNSPSWDSDRFAPVYACASGIVTFADRGSGTWGNLIVIEHDPLPDGTVVWSRCAHLDTMLIVVGDRVTRGQEIGRIGNAFGKLAYHLHFDIAKTRVLLDNAGHWPGNDLSGVTTNYYNPKSFIAVHRPAGS